MGTYSWDLDGRFDTALSESIRYPRLPICCEYPDASLEPTTPTEIGLLPDTESALALTPTLGHDSIGARSERRRWILARSDMKPLLPLLTLFFFGPATVAWAQSDPSTEVAIPNEPILSGHSHNDYLRQTPLWDALSLGFISIEVDIHLVEGALLVGHEEENLDATRTLQSLYLEPLRNHVRAHNGWVYPSEHSLDLLIDIKSDARSTYEALRGVLAQYSEMLTTYSETQVQTRAISVIVSGNRPRALMMAEAVRMTSYDGRIEDIEDLAARVPANFISMISDDWEDHFSWRGLGSLSDRDSRRLAQRLETAHRSGYRLRFWNIPAPDHRPIEEVWSQLLDAGVDLLSVDDVDAYRDFLVKRGRNDSPERPHGEPTTIRIGDEAFSAGATRLPSAPPAPRGAAPLAARPRPPVPGAALRSGPQRGERGAAYA